MKGNILYCEIHFLLIINVAYFPVVEIIDSWRVLCVVAALFT